MEVDRFVKIFDKELMDYLRPTWICLLIVAFIGQFQILNVYFLHILEHPPFLPIGFLKLTQLIWGLILAFNVFYVVWKKDFTFLQAIFTGFLYFIGFGVLKTITRTAMGHDLRYLLLGDASRLSPLLECFLIIFALTIIGAGAGLYEKRG